MRILKEFILVVGLAVLVLGDTSTVKGIIPIEPTTKPSSPNTTTDTPITIFPPTSNGTTPSTTTTSTTTKPTTATPITTSTTTPPTTSKPTTTTPAPKPPTTAKPTPPTPTPKPTPPAPTPKPTPPAPTPDPEVKTWTANYTQNTNYSCIVAQMAVQIDIPYITKENKTEHWLVNVPQNATASGNCSADKQFLELAWNLEKNMTDKVRFSFAKNDTSKMYRLDSVNVDVHVQLPGQDEKLWSLSHRMDEFQTKMDRSYKCSAEKKLSLNATQNNTSETIGILKLCHLQFEAYANVTKAEFVEATLCEEDDVSDVVPIVVGVVLGVFIILILIGFLYGRRRAQARGYLSM